jgi:hypothetical protein
MKHCIDETHKGLIPFKFSPLFVRHQPAASILRLGEL